MKLRRSLSMALCVLMLFSLLPLSALAAEPFTVDGFTYSVNNDGDGPSVTLTGVDASLSGTLTVPETVTKGEITYTVTKIGAYAFYQNTGITGVTLPESVTSIGEAAFAESGLTSFTFPTGVTEVPEKCFSGCPSLSSVTLAPETTAIGIEAFASTPALTELELPAALEYICMNAFLPPDREQPILTLYYMGTSMDWWNITQYTDREEVGSLQPPNERSLFVAAIICHDVCDFSNGGICTCGKSAAASITLADGTTTTYYETLTEALELVSEANGGDYAGCTVRLLRSVTEPDIPLSGAGVNCTIDLGGVTFASSNSYGLQIHTNAVVTIQNGSITAQNSGGVWANTAAQVTLKNVSTPTVEPAHADASIVLDSTCTLTSHVRLTAGELRLNGAPAIAGLNGGSQIVVTGGMVTVNGDLGSAVYKVSGGSDATYPLPFARAGDGITLNPQNFASAAEGYYVGRNADSGLSLFEGSCSHAETDNDGRCDSCGVPFAAKVTVGTANPVYYTDMDAAVNAWKDDTSASDEKTLTLLQNGGYSPMMDFIVLPEAKRTLDLNGCAFDDNRGFRLQGTEFIIQDSSEKADGVYEGQTYLVGNSSSFTLLSGVLDGGESSAIYVEASPTGCRITIKDGTVTSGRRCISDEAGAAEISIEGGSLSTTGANFSTIYGGKVSISGEATVKHEAEGNTTVMAVKSSELTVKDAPVVGRIYFSEGYQLNLSGYTGAGQKIFFTEDYDSSSKNAIKLPEEYGFFTEDVNQVTMITGGTTVQVLPIHEHSWSFSTEGAVITAVCSGAVGTCPVENKTATITLKAPADLTYDGAPKECTVEQSVENLFALEPVGYSEAPVAIGDYTATLEHEGATATLSFSIIGIDIGGKTVEPIAGQTYTGTAITPAVTVTGLTEGTDFTVSYADNTNAGTATVTVTGTGIYSGSKTVSFTIRPAEISVTAKLTKDSYDYTGSVVEPEVSVSTSFGGVNDMNLAADMDYTVDYGQETAAGSIVPVTVKPAADGNFSFEPVTLHYSIGHATPVYTVPSFTASYGQTLKDLKFPTADNGTWSWDAGENTPVGAPGEQRHKATFTPTDSNYKTVPLEVVVKVEPAVITVTSVSVSDKTYDGSDRVSVTTLGLSGIVAGESVTVAELHGLTATAPSANAGTYTEVTLPTLSLTGEDAANYTLTQPGKVSAAYSIAPKALYPTVEVAAGTYYYTGTAQTPTVTVKDGTTVIPATEYDLSYTCNTYVGVGYATVSDKTGGNYTIGGVTGTFNIQPAVITITADNKSAATGQKAPALTYTVSGLVNGEKLSKEPTVSYVTTPDMSRAGTTVIRAGGAVAPSGNYTISYVDGTLTVSKAASSGGGSYSGGYTGNVAVTVDMSGVQLQSKTYDGKPLSYGGKASARYYTGDFTYTWYNANGYRLGEAPTDAGDYVLRATVSRSGYTGYASKNVTIRKAQLTVTADDIRIEVGEKLPTLTYSVKGLAASDKLKTVPQLSYDGEPDTSKPGKTPIVVSGAEAPDSKNYEKTIKYIEGTLTVGDVTEEKAEETPKPTEPAEPIRKLEISVGSADKALEKALDSKNSAYYELSLRESSDGGLNWTAADSQLPEGGVKVSLPLPEGSNENSSFRVIHADGEYPVTVTQHEDGQYYLDFTATSLAPVAVGWTAPGKEGGFPWWILLAGLGLSGVAGGIVLWRNRRRYY